jgi:hypothetical protein
LDSADLEFRWVVNIATTGTRIVATIVHYAWLSSRERLNIFHRTIRSKIVLCQIITRSNILNIGLWLITVIEANATHILKSITRNVCHYIIIIHIIFSKQNINCFWVSKYLFFPMFSNLSIFHCFVSFYKSNRFVYM